jgi:FKBP-type peptidyl-prolyl cis-trans isomerase SlyD
MQVAAHKVVTIEYTLKNDAGEVLDTSDGDEPLAYIHGMGNIVPGLEKALDGKASGDTIDVTVPPEEGYGAHDEELVMNLPVRKLPDKNPKAGAHYRVQTPEGPRVIAVKSVKGDYAIVDANHPLAGVTLHFHVKVVGVRDATDEERQHGHVHGAGGHHH